MSVDQCLYALQGLALARDLPIPQDLRGLDVLWPFLESLRQDKAVVLLQFVPRSAKAGAASYEVVIGGGLLVRGQEISIVNDLMSAAVAQAIVEYAHRCWQFDW